MKTETKIIKESNMTCGSIATVEANESQQTGHTPGPWKVTEGNMGPRGDMTVDIYAGEIFITGIEGHNDPEKQKEGWFSPEVMEANARLIAAAPELLETLKIIKTEMDASKRDFPRDPMSHLGKRFDWSLVTEAIAKAEGKQ